MAEWRERVRHRAEEAAAASRKRVFRRRRMACLDIGTNSVLLLVAERDEAGTVTVLKDEIRTPRLGEGLRAGGVLLPEAVARTAEAVSELTSLARGMSPDEVILSATSAARDALNREAFTKAVETATGLEVRVLSAHDEARLSYLSVTAELEGDSPVMVADIGGGSTEIGWGIGGRFDAARSVQAGAVKLLDAYLASDPPDEAELMAARDAADEAFLPLIPLPNIHTHYGTAGTFTQLAALELELTPYDPVRVTNHVLTRTAVGRSLERLVSMTLEERRKLPGMDPNRADVIVAGAILVDRLAERLGIKSFLVADRGIRFGVLFDRLRGFVPPLWFAGRQT